jgi:glycosyltransferase involved in cell wall biosynthesis
MVVLLAVLGPPPSTEQLTDAAAVPGLQLIETGLPLDWTACRASDVEEAASALAILAERAEADLVQLHTPALAVADFAAPVVSVIHSCVGTWWAAVGSGPIADDLAWRAALVREGIERSDAVVAPSRSFAEAVQKHYRLSRKPQPVTNGRASLHPLEAGEPVDMAVTAGRLWDAGKNVAAFDRAAALSSLRFAAAGPLEGPDGSRARLDHAEALGTMSSEDLAALLARKPIFVSAALYEPFGLAVLEAAQAGCALVLADRPVFRELWSGAARFVDPLDEHAIAAAVQGLVASPPERARLGEAARRRAERFTPDRTAAAMLSLYTGLLGQAQKVAA